MKDEIMKELEEPGQGAEASPVMRHVVGFHGRARSIDTTRSTAKPVPLAPSLHIFAPPEPNEHAVASTWTATLNNLDTVVHFTTSEATGKDRAGLIPWTPCPGTVA